MTDFPVPPDSHSPPWPAPVAEPPAPAPFVAKPATVTTTKTVESTPTKTTKRYRATLNVRHRHPTDDPAVAALAEAAEQKRLEGANQGKIGDQRRVWEGEATDEADAKAKAMKQFEAAWANWYVGNPGVPFNQAGYPYNPQGGPATVDASGQPVYPSGPAPVDAKGGYPAGRLGPSGRSSPLPAHVAVKADDVTVQPI